MILLALSVPCVIGGSMLLVSSLMRPEQLWQGAMMSIAAFCITLGISAYCLVKQSDSKINKAIKDSSKSFSKNMERLVSKEKNLLKLD